MSATDFAFFLGWSLGALTMAAVILICRDEVLRGQKVENHIKLDGVEFAREVTGWWTDQIERYRDADSSDGGWKDQHDQLYGDD